MSIDCGCCQVIHLNTSERWSLWILLFRCIALVGLHSRLCDFQLYLCLCVPALLSLLSLQRQLPPWPRSQAYFPACCPLTKCSSQACQKAWVCSHQGPQGGRWANMAKLHDDGPGCNMGLRGSWWGAWGREWGRVEGICASPESDWVSSHCYSELQAMCVIFCLQNPFKDYRKAV